MISRTWLPSSMTWNNYTLTENLPNDVLYIKISLLLSSGLRGEKSTEIVVWIRI